MLHHSDSSVKPSKCPKIHNIRPPLLVGDLCTFSARHVGRDFFDLRLNRDGDEVLLKSWLGRTVPGRVLSNEGLRLAAIDALSEHLTYTNDSDLEGTNDV
jgi:hypothetical protein